MVVEKPGVAELADTLASLVRIGQHVSPARIQELFDKDNLTHVSGLTLYKIHAIPTIFEQQTLLAPAPTFEYAELRARLDWSFLEHEKTTFWRRRTRDLGDGALQALRDEVPDLLAESLSDYEVEVPSYEGSLVNGKKQEEQRRERTEKRPGTPTPEPLTNDANLRRLQRDLRPSDALVGILRKAIDPFEENTRAGHQIEPNDGSRRSDPLKIPCKGAPAAPWTASLSKRTRRLGQGEVWRSMSTADRRVSFHDTRKMQPNEGSCQFPNILSYFETDNNRSARYRKYVLRACNIGEPTILQLLIGSSPAKLTTEILIEKILCAIARRLEQTPNATTMIRLEWMRIDYNPTASDTCSIPARLRAAIYRNLRPNVVTDFSEDRTDCFGDLLRPLVYINRHTDAFSDLQQGWEHDSKCSTDFQSCLAWCAERLKPLYPLRAASRKKIVLEIVDELCRRVRDLDVNHALLLPRGMPEWNLSRNDQGFAVKLLNRFNRGDLSSAEYHGLLEQSMAAFFRAHPDLTWIKSMRGKA